MGMLWKIKNQIGVAFSLVHMRIARGLTKENECIPTIFSFLITAILCSPHLLAPAKAIRLPLLPAHSSLVTIAITTTSILV